MNILLEIYTKDGELIASNKIEGLAIDLVANTGNEGTTKSIQIIVNKKFKEKIDILFDDTEIQEALNIN